MTPPQANDAAASRPSLTSSVRRRREQAALSQVQLASLVGVSRQAVIAIESGKRVPSTALALTLARALCCSVEALFALTPEPLTGVVLSSAGERGQGAGAEPHGAQEKLGTAARRVVLGKVNSRWVAHPAEQARAAHGLVVASDADKYARSVDPLRPPVELERNVLIAGCAPLLGVLSEHTSAWRAEGHATWVAANSEYALSLLESGLVHIAGLHLEGGGTPHTELLRQRFTERSMTVVHLTTWQQGVLVAPGNPLGITQVSDLLRPKLRLIRREPGAGSSLLLKHLLQRVTGSTYSAGSSQAAALDGPVANGHAGVAQFVRAGVADAGIAIESAAVAAGLDFVPLAEERFDLVMRSQTAQEPQVARVLDCLTAAAFRREVTCLPGYDCSRVGESLQMKGDA